LPAPLNALGEVARTQGDYATARSLFEESRGLLFALEDPVSGAWAVQALGELALEQGDPAAPALLKESLGHFRAAEDRRGIAFALSHLGEAARLGGDLPRARSLHEESLAIQRELGQKSGIAMSLGYLARVAADEREVAAAHSLYRESLALRCELGDRRSIAACLEGLGGLVVWAGCAGLKRTDPPDLTDPTDPTGYSIPASHPPFPSPAWAARLFGTAQALREAVGAPLPPVERREHERRVAAVRVQLGEAAFSTAWREGRERPLEQTLDLVAPQVD
jgi:tetratricopeptide (TPR) repeat protein